MNDYMKQVGSLDIVSKWKVYCRYLRSHFSLKHAHMFYENSREIKDLTRDECLGFDDFCKENGQMDDIYYWYWRTLK